MNDPASSFYDDLSEHYHLIYNDWRLECESQAKAIDSIIRKVLGRVMPEILDVTCGIGTQVLGLADLGYVVEGADFSHQAVVRAKREAQAMDSQFRFSRLMSAKSRVSCAVSMTWSFPAKTLCRIFFRIRTYAVHSLKCADVWYLAGLVS